jgi:hypothetical protein
MSTSLATYFFRCTSYRIEVSNKFKVLEITTCNFLVFLSYTEATSVFLQMLSMPGGIPGRG